MYISLEFGEEGLIYPWKLQKKLFFALFFGGEIYDWEQESSFFCFARFKKIKYKKHTVTTVFYFIIFFFFLNR